MKHKRGHSIPFMRVSGSESHRPLYLQLYMRVSEGVLRGVIAPGSRLPSARTLAQEEGVSRNTVEAAFRQLQAEGFVERRVGSGTWVTEDLPERLLRPRTARRRRERIAVDSSEVERDPASVNLSRRGQVMNATESEPTLVPGLVFAPCLPGVDTIPVDTWNRIAARHVRNAKRSHGVPPAGGLPALREAVAEYLHLTRGVRCSADRVVILNSTQQAIHLVARLLLDAGDRVWVEDPGYVSARRGFRGEELRLHPVPVDDDGMDVAQGARTAPDARLVYVTPSHQYPMGVTLPLARRLELLEWSAGTGGWIFEDDYDSELRHEGRPLASIQGIDDSGRVLYAGTFNKILFPGVRLAYLVLPPSLIEPFARGKEITDGIASPLLQGVLADFMREGHFSVHVRRVRDIYRERRDVFMDMARRLLPDFVEIGPADAGTHVALGLPETMDDALIAAQARDLGLAVPALSSHAVENPIRGLLVHYGHAPGPKIEEGVRLLGRLLREPFVE